MRASATVREWEGLERRAEAWVGRQRNGPHLVRTRDWALDLDPDGDEALRLAALLHDVDRHAGGVPLAEQVASWEDETAVAEHAERSARIAGDWLRSEGASQALAARVEVLIRLHEVGGTPPADILQAADSLSFLEVNPAARWLRERLAGRDEAERKLRSMHDRIRVDRAREPAGPLLEQALAELAQPSGVIQDQASAERARGQATEGRRHGNTG